MRKIIYNTTQIDVNVCIDRIMLEIRLAETIDLC